MCIGNTFGINHNITKQIEVIKDSLNFVSSLRITLFYNFLYWIGDI